MQNCGGADSVSSAKPVLGKTSLGDSRHAFQQEAAHLRKDQMINAEYE